MAASASNLVQPNNPSWLALEAMDVGIILLDENLGVEFINTAFLKIIELPEAIRNQSLDYRGLAWKLVRLPITGLASF